MDSSVKARCVSLPVWTGWFAVVMRADKDAGMGALMAITDREIEAGYDPARLKAMRVFVVGAGALGQNALLDLAMSQVGELWLCDFDPFGKTNPPRSPCYPTAIEAQRWSNFKSAVVAHKLREVVHWTDQPKIAYYVGRVQELGDLPFRSATVVVSAVDNASTRAYLSAMCKKHRLALVEGGFHANHLSFSVFSPNVAEPCWQCSAPAVLAENVSFSCEVYARDVEEAGFIPATQTGAAVLGGLLAEAAIQVAHGNKSLWNHRCYLDIRTGHGYAVLQARDQRCSGQHQSLAAVDFALTTKSDATIGALMEELSDKHRQPVVNLPQSFVRTAPCQKCHQPLSVWRPLCNLSRQPTCQDCGGEWPDADGSILPTDIITRITHTSSELFALPCRAVAIVPGCILQVSCADQCSMFVEMPVESDPFTYVP